MIGTRAFFLACFAVSIVLAGILASGALWAHDTPAQVKSGLAVWRARGCEGCHSIYGQGGSYAPDLTHIYDMRGEGYLREFLVNPNAFHPGERVMPRLGLTKAETDDLLAFLSWVGQQEAANRWPPRAIYVSGGGSIGGSASASNIVGVESTDPVARGRALFSRAPANCATCHLLEPDAVRVGPSLAGIAARAATRVPGQSAEEYIRNSILNPSDYIVEGFPDAMQKNLGEALSSQDINDLITYLMTLI